MDPLQRFLEQVRATLGDALPGDALQTLEASARNLFAQFELVPKHEYEAHMDILASLNAQVAELEQRIALLEQD